MRKVFNVSADCKPEIHYMVNIEERLHEIKSLVDKGEYFAINRARQYGKTTTLRALARFLQNEYLVVSLDFQMLGDAKFKNENIFSLAFASIFLRAIQMHKSDFHESMSNVIDSLQKIVKSRDENIELLELFAFLSDICAASAKPIVLMIDEVDSATNNQVFLDFLGQLRGYYIDRDVTPTFHSVILVGVYDIKNLKRKLRTEDEHKTNSPWNMREGNESSGSLLTFDDCPWDYREPAPYSIAAEFNVDMSFSVIDIQGMLSDYNNDYNVGMDTKQIALLIYSYTSGYPFLVSRICKIIDEKVVGGQGDADRKLAWTKQGVLEAVKILLAEKNTLFESLNNKLEDYQELRQLLYSLLFTGRSIVYNPDNDAIDVALMFGFVQVKGGTVVIANRIFETRLYNMFLSSSEVQESDIYKAALQDKNQFVQSGRLNMELVLQKFVEHFTDLYGDCTERFIEEDGRRYFLLYLRPIINGAGNYYIESRTRSLRRTDVIVDYHGEQFIIEMKIWHGDEYNHRGEEQLAEYLDDYHLEKGYMLSFNFNKNKKCGIKEILCANKKIIEAVV